jgi:hypothetical protein
MKQMKNTGIVFIAIAVAVFTISVVYTTNAIEAVTPEALESSLGDVMDTMNTARQLTVTSLLLGLAGICLVVIGYATSRASLRESVDR